MSLIESFFSVQSYLLSKYPSCLVHTSIDVCTLLSLQLVYTMPTNIGSRYITLFHTLLQFLSEMLTTALVQFVFPLRCLLNNSDCLCTFMYV